MAGKVEARKAALREKLVDLAEAQIEAEGLMSLRARDLAKDAGCSVGTIYSHFDDLQALILAVNGRTFQRLGAAVSEAVAAASAAPPTERLIVMSGAYLRFAESHPKLWRALFDVEMRRTQTVPEWYQAAVSQLFAFIKHPLSELFPGANESELDLMTRTLFSSVHGIVLLGLEDRISAVPQDHMEWMIKLLLTRVTRA